MTANTNALTYNAYIQQICTMAIYTYSTVGGVITPTDTEVQLLVPSMLNYAELRIQKDLDLLASQFAITTYTLTPGNNLLTVAANDFQTIKSISCLTGTAKIPVLPVSLEFIQNAFNDSSASYQGLPTYFCVQNSDQATGGNTSYSLRFGPYPDQAYALTIVGTQWTPSLYVTASTDGLGTTYISTNYPDLLIQASMVYLSQFQRNFAPTSNDPQMAGGFEVQYQTLLKSAIELENRKKFRDAVWSSQSQSPVATPTR